VVQRICAICESEFSARLRTAKVCSSDCRREDGRRRAAAWYAENGRREDVVARVAEASRRRYEKVKADPDLLVKRRQATADWRRQNPDVVAAQYRQWRLANADQVRAKVQRRRARLLGAWIEDVDPQGIWDRDKGICQLCSSPVDPDLPWPDRMSKTLDHIVPLAKGGTHEWANVQLSHAVCNSRKNDT
jgi:5-methylcytosine-specific restriction endonuclease McrA